MGLHWDRLLSQQCFPRSCVVHAQVRAASAISTQTPASRPPSRPEDAPRQTLPKQTTMMTIKTMTTAKSGAASQIQYEQPGLRTMETPKMATTMATTTRMVPVARCLFSPFSR